MTSPHVSEQEAEAAARVIADLCETFVIEAPKLPWSCWMGAARSILTAAAQVRERARNVYDHPTFCPPDPPTEPDSGPDVLGERKGD